LEVAREERREINNEELRMKNEKGVRNVKYKM